MKEFFIDILPDLYQSIAIIAMIGYVTQIWQLTQIRTRAQSISITTWLIWMSTWIVTLLYALIHLEDWRVSLIAMINIAGHLAVISLTCYHRFWRDCQ